MKKNKGGLLELQIGRFGKVFIPDEAGICGVDYGERETTEPGDAVASFLPFSKVAIIEYKYKGKYIKAFYRHGRWEIGTAMEMQRGLDKHPRFHVWGLLK